MKKILAILGIVFFSIIGVALAQYGPHGGVYYGGIPSCPYTWACSKVLGNSVACSCTNPSTNAVQDYIYTPTQVNSINNQEGVNSNIVNEIDNAK